MAVLSVYHFWLVVVRLNGTRDHVDARGDRRDTPSIEVEGEVRHSKRAVRERGVLRRSLLLKQLSLARMPRSFLKTYISGGIANDPQKEVDELTCHRPVHVKRFFVDRRGFKYLNLRLHRRNWVYF